VDVTQTKQLFLLFGPISKINYAPICVYRKKIDLEFLLKVCTELSYSDLLFNKGGRGLVIALDGGV